jgi:hypothetical protein
MVFDRHAAYKTFSIRDFSEKQMLFRNKSNASFPCGLSRDICSLIVTDFRQKCKENSKLLKFFKHFAQALD